jgi:hypothetical protein
MKRLLAPRAQVPVFSRSTAALAASRRRIAIEVQGRSVDGNVRLDHWRDGRWRGHLRNGRGWNRRVAGKVRFENRIDCRVRGYGDRGLRPSGIEASEVRVDVDVIDDRLGFSHWFINVGLRSEMDADETIPFRGLGQHGCWLAPGILGRALLLEGFPLLKRQLSAATLAEVAWRHRFNFAFVAAHDTSPGVRVRAPARNGKGSANAGHGSCADFLEILTI